MSEHTTCPQDRLAAAKQKLLHSQAHIARWLEHTPAPAGPSVWVNAVQTALPVLQSPQGQTGWACWRIGRASIPNLRCCWWVRAHYCGGGNDLQRARTAPDRSTCPHRRNTMLYAVVLLLLVFWAVGLATANTLGGFIHLLLLMAVIVSQSRVIEKR
jgi:hypothetical protein